MFFALIPELVQLHLHVETDLPLLLYGHHGHQNHHRNQRRLAKSFKE
jgi:hypothetical protein